MKASFHLCFGSVQSVLRSVLCTCMVSISIILLSEIITHMRSKSIKCADTLSSSQVKSLWFITWMEFWLFSFLFIALVVHYLCGGMEFILSSLRYSIPKCLCHFEGYRGKREEKNHYTPIYLPWSVQVTPYFIIAMCWITMSSSSELQASFCKMDDFTM